MCCTQYNNLNYTQIFLLEICKLVILSNVVLYYIHGFAYIHSSFTRSIPFSVSNYLPIMKFCSKAEIFLHTFGYLKRRNITIKLFP